MNTPFTRTHAEHLDRSDALASLRNEFHLPQRHDGSPSVYLCGHSLGLASRRAIRIVNEELEHWARLGVEGHFDSPRPWLSYHELLTGGLARLTGAAPLEVVAMNSLTVNLHLMLATFYRPTPQRHKILVERQAFSSDRYAVTSQIARHGFDPATSLLAAGDCDDFGALRTGSLCELIEREGAQIAVIVLPGVQYLSGQCLDMRTIAECGRRHGCIVGFDLAHAVGNVPLQLHDWNADFAVWCGYKYLNGGPGATAGCFVHERHARNFDLPRFAGWWGHDKSSRFDMPEQFRPLPGAEGWQISNPPILSTAPLVASLELFERAGMQALRAKSVLLTGYLESLLSERLRDSVAIVTPSDRDQRGCQLSLRLRRLAEAARDVHETLSQRGFICDWREPDVIRVAPVPMYNSFTDVWEFVEALKQALTREA
jgi:kynureninase